jgi:hypothetical protein
MTIIENPIITGDFNPKFYWTGNYFEDAKRINNPHIKKEGKNEDRIKETEELLGDLCNIREFWLEDAFKIQNKLLSINNWKRIKSGFRTYNKKISDVDFTMVEEFTKGLFPVSYTTKELLLEWYKQIQLIHPLSDLNGRVFGIIVSILYKQNA